MSYAKPIPAITPEMRPFFEAAKRHELVVQRCTQCGTHRFPAREICSSCLSREVEWVPVSGAGEVFSYNVMHQVYHPGFAGRGALRGRGGQAQGRREDELQSRRRAAACDPHRHAGAGGLRGHHRRGDAAEVRAGVTPAAASLDSRRQIR